MGRCRLGSVGSIHRKSKAVNGRGYKRRIGVGSMLRSRRKVKNWRRLNLAILAKKKRK